MTKQENGLEASQIKSTRPAVTQGQLEAIGLVAAEWSMAQSVLEHMIWVLIPVDQEIGRMLTTHLQEESRLNIVNLLSARLPPELAVKASDLTKTFNDIRVYRNQIIHNVWAGEPKDLAVGYKPSARGEFKINATHWSESDIRGIALEISEWTVDAVNFLNNDLWWPAFSLKFFEQLLQAKIQRDQENK